MIIGKLLANAATKALDGVAFDNVAADANRPAGLLNGVTPISATTPGASDLEAAASDLAALAAAIADAGIDPSDMVIVAAWPQAMKLHILSGPNFKHAILGTNALADGHLVGVAPAGVGVGYGAAPPEIETVKEATVHFEDTSPLPIGTPGSPNTVAAPTRSAFQTDVLIIRVRARAAWAALPGSVQTITNVGW